MLELLTGDSRSTSASRGASNSAGSGRPELASLQRFGAPEALEECVEIGELRVHVVGLSLTLESGQVVAGAAADLNAAPFDRARFELLERLAILEADAGEAAGSGAQKRSRSNGVALQAGSAHACSRAALELVERDRILRSWYGGARPLVLGGVRAWPETLERYYSLTLCRFDSGLECERGGAQVAGIIAFPRSPEAPLSMGFAARYSFEDAVRAAGRELLQQVAFGWGEPVPEELPEPAATPEFHLDFYGCSKSHRLLRGWLDGEHEGRGPELPPLAGDFRYADITPSWMEGGFRVVRAEHPAAVPLVFGLGHPWFPELPEMMRVQPIA